MLGNIKRKKSNDKTIIILLILVNILFICGFLFIGITSKNIGFYLPRRLNKMLAIILVSYSVGYSSITFQTITNNHILTPSVMGLDSLYMFIQTVIVFFFGQRSISLMTGNSNFLISLVIMIVASTMLFLFLFKGEGSNVHFLILTGMVMGSLFGGLSTFMQVILDPNEFSILSGKMFASFNNINTSLLGICMVIIIITFFITMKDLPYLDVLSLGIENAINLGVNYKKLVLKTLIVTGILVSVSTVLVGPITFLGILIVSLGRRLVSSYKHSILTTVIVLLGCLFLNSGLFFAERIFKFETTISVIINFIGGIYFIYLMLKESKG
jgi:iron complex transport system permease protein